MGLATGGEDGDGEPAILSSPPKPPRMRRVPVPHLQIKSNQIIRAAATTDEITLLVSNHFIEKVHGYIIHAQHLGTQYTFTTVYSNSACLVIRTPAHAPIQLSTTLLPKLDFT